MSNPAPHAVPQPTFPNTEAPAPSPTRPLRGIGAATRWLLLGSAVVALVTILSDAWGIATLDAYNNGFVDVEELDGYFVISALVNIVAIVPLLAAAICWLIWQYRAAASCPVGTLRRSPRWHVWSWFIPVVSLWFPLQNVSDLSRASGAALGASLRGVWWAVGIAGGLASYVAVHFLGADNVSDLISGLTADIVGMVLLIASYPLSWIIVARITDAIDPGKR